MNGMSQAQIEPWRLRRIGLSQDSGRMAADFYFYGSTAVSRPSDLPGRFTRDMMWNQISAN